MKFRQSQHRRQQRQPQFSTRVLIRTAALSLTTGVCSSFASQASLRPAFGIPSRFARCTPFSRLYIIAPPGSGYATPDDETSPFPDTYEPMMEYPGTMRPGRTPEDQPFHDLPIGDDDPDPIPWPHFQQIEWHHRWDPPHPHPIPMEEFIEMEGRWATPEMEAAMRAGARRDVRERKELAEAEKKATVVMDDEEDEFEADVPVELGEGIFGQLGSVAEDAVTAAAVAPPTEEETKEEAAVEEVEDEMDDLDNFLLDLGLDADMDVGTKDTEGGDAPKDSMEMLMEDSDEEGGTDTDLGLELGLLDDDDGEGADLGIALEEDDDGDVTAMAGIDEDEESLGFDEDDEGIIMGDDGVTTVPLDDDFSDSDATEGENPFDDGGFDYDDGGMDMDGGDMW